MNQSGRLITLSLAGGLLLGVLLLGGCVRSGNGDDNRRLARVGNEFLTLEEALQTLPSSLLASDSLRALTSYRDEWVRTQLVLREAERLGLRQNQEVQRRLEQARQEVFKDALRNQVMRQYGQQAAVSDEEARNYFQAHRDQFVLQERYVRFRHLVTNTIEDARAARQQLLQGVEWSTVAHRFGLQPEKAINESEQFWPISMAAADQEIMHRYLEIIGIREISPVRRLGSSYHFVQLMESREEGEQPDLEWLMSQIKEWLMMEKRRRYFSSYIKNLYLNAESNNEVETFNVLDTNLNFNAAPADSLESNIPDD